MPYPDREADGQDQNKTEDELDAEALKAFQMIKKGTSRREVATTLGISQRTLIRRLERAILSPVPKTVLREIEHERLEDLTLRIHEALDGAQNPTLQDIALLTRELRQLSATRAKLQGLTVDTNHGAPEEEFDPLPPALRAAAEEAERRLAEEGERLRRGTDEQAS